MLVRRVLGALALVLAGGWLPAAAASPASAAATSLPGDVTEVSAAGAPAPLPGTAAPRTLDLTVAAPPSPGRLTLLAYAGEWAAGSRAVLQRRTETGWTKLAVRRFSPSGRARWTIPMTERRTTYRVITRVDGERIDSGVVRVSSGR